VFRTIPPAVVSLGVMTAPPPAVTYWALVPEGSVVVASPDAGVLVDTRHRPVAPAAGTGFWGLWGLSVPGIAWPMCSLVEPRSLEFNQESSSAIGYTTRAPTLAYLGPPPKQRILLSVDSLRPT
jgi:hypothetical protein